MAASSRPDIIVGIDFGQTCTGVAYNVLAHGTDNIRWIQKWPGRSNANENKVPSILIYPRDQDSPSAWGFKAELLSHQDAGHGVVREWFKTLLDPDNLIRQKEMYPNDNVSHEDVRRWFREYLSLLYDHITAKLSAELPNFAWRYAKVEFLFSVPTTWSPGLVEQFKLIIGQAGFGGPANANHTVTIGLTEPEASAVYTSTNAAGIFKEDDVLVVCDAGGGTTDMSALRVTPVVGALSLTQLRGLDVVSGESVGAAAIDYDFEVLARGRLRDAFKRTDLGMSQNMADHAAWVMAKGWDWQNTKCEHGAADNTPTFSIAIPGLPRGYTNLAFRIDQNEMIFDREDLCAIFDKQIEAIFGLIDRQLDSLQRKWPSAIISHLILSGGLGQSLYVQRRLRDRYGEGSYRFPNAQFMQVRVAPDPQLSVCKGLVADRLRKIKVGQGVMGWRCCRASYGLICKELYDKNNNRHIGRPTERDSRDGRLYVPDTVDWFVFKGMPVSIDEPVVHKFVRKIMPGDPRKVFPTKLVVSYKDKEFLPHKMEAGVEKLCEVESDFSAVDESRFKEKNKALWKPGKLYYEVSYQVKVIIGPADLCFELWFDNQKLSKDHSIKVEWAAATAPSTAVLQTSSIPVEDGVLQWQNREAARWTAQRSTSADVAPGFSVPGRRVTGLGLDRMFR